MLSKMCYIIFLMKQDDPSVCMSDFAMAMMSMYMGASFDVRSIAANGKHYQLLKAKGYVEDLEYCFCSLPQCPIPVCNNGHIEIL